MRFIFINSCLVACLCLVLLAPDHRVTWWQYSAVIALVIAIVINAIAYGIEAERNS